MTGATEHRNALPETAERVLRFWFDIAGEKKWYFAGAEFDAELAEQFAGVHEAVAAGACEAWRETASGALAYIIVLDQFSRNLYRNDARSFAFDDQALDAARAAIARDFDLTRQRREQAFFYVPFMHSERRADQDEGVRLFETRAPDSGSLRYMREHRDIIARFGRFPHRNRVLGRTPTAEETAYLESGGFNPG